MKTTQPLLTKTGERYAQALPSLAGLFAVECGLAPRATAMTNRAWTIANAGKAGNVAHGMQFGGTVNTVVLASKISGSDQKFSIRRFSKPLVANG